VAAEGPSAVAWQAAGVPDVVRSPAGPPRAQAGGDGAERLHVAATGDLDVATLYRILALRVDVFVVEQTCPYPELDGRDLEPTTRQLWVSGHDGAVLATLRLLEDASGEARIGRVATAATARGRGLAAALMEQALTLAGDRVVVLEAQSYLLDWYARFGFRSCGPEYLEDDILHTPMRRDASAG
jgi:ElaA protein